MQIALNVLLFVLGISLAALINSKPKQIQSYQDTVRSFLGGSQRANHDSAECNADDKDESDLIDEDDLLTKYYRVYYYCS